MGESIHITVNYNQQGKTLMTDNGYAIALGYKENTAAPYELLLGALSSCLFSTYESIAKKMQLEYNTVDMDIVGVKRDDKVAMLETVNIKVDVTGVSEQDQAKFTKAFEIGTRYCSVYNTLSKIAEMKWDINFQ